MLIVESQLGTGNFPDNDTWVQVVTSHSDQGSGWLFPGPQERTSQHSAGKLNKTLGLHIEFSWKIKGPTAGAVEKHSCGPNLSVY